MYLSFASFQVLLPVFFTANKNSYNSRLPDQTSLTIDLGQTLIKRHCKPC